MLSNGVTLKNSQKEFTDSVAGESLFNTDNPYVIVVNAYAVEGLLKVSETVLIDTQDRITYSQAEKIEKDILTELNNSEIYESNRKYNKEDDFFRIFEVTMQTISNNQFVTFTILVNLLSIYLFIIGMVLNLSILSLNYLFIMRSHVDNIKVYRRLGVNEKESSDIRKKESRYIYTTPLVCAGVFLSIILGVYISLNYAEIHAYVSIKGVILNASRYLLLVIGMTVLYAFITMRIIKKGEKDTYVQ